MSEQTWIIVFVVAILSIFLGMIFGVLIANTKESLAKKKLNISEKEVEFYKYRNDTVYQILEHFAEGESDRLRIVRGETAGRILFQLLQKSKGQGGVVYEEDIREIAKFYKVKIAEDTYL